MTTRGRNSSLRDRVEADDAKVMAVRDVCGRFDFFECALQYSLSDLDLFVHELEDKI